MGLPALLIVLADNQKPIASALVDAGVALSLGPAGFLSTEDIRNKLRGLATSHEVLEKMSVRGRALIDGRGPERVVAAMLEGGLNTSPMQPAVSGKANERS